MSCILTSSGLVPLGNQGVAEERRKDVNRKAGDGFN